MKLSEFINVLQDFKAVLEDHDPNLVMIIDDVEVEGVDISFTGTIETPFKRGELSTLPPSPVWDTDVVLTLREKE